MCCFDSEQNMLIDLPQNVLKAVFIFATPQAILRLKKVCRYLYNFIKVCRLQLPMPDVETLIILAPSTSNDDHWEFLLEYADVEPDEQGSVEKKTHTIQYCNLPHKKYVWLDRDSPRYRGRSYVVATSLLNGMKKQLCQFRHSRLHIREFDKARSIWRDLRFLLQMLNDFYGEYPSLKPDNTYFQLVNLTTVPIVEWQTFLAQMNTNRYKQSFKMEGCIIPHHDYGLPSISASGLLNSIDRYDESNNRLIGTGQPDVSHTMDVLQNLMLRPPGMDTYKLIHLDKTFLTASHWIGLIEAWQNGVDRVAVDSIAANENHRSLVMDTHSYFREGNAIFRQVAQHFNCEHAFLVIKKPRSKQLLIFFNINDVMHLALLRFAQPWNRQSRRLIRLMQGGYKDEFIDESVPTVYCTDKHLALYRRMKELGIMSEEDRRFMSGEGEVEPLNE